MDDLDLTYTSNQPKEKFFKQVDKRGGWPLDKKYAIAYASKSTKKHCKFSKEKITNEFWTTFTSADEYYYWKISSSTKEKLKAETIVEFLGNTLLNDR